MATDLDGGQCRSRKKKHTKHLSVDQDKINKKVNEAMKKVDAAMAKVKAHTKVATPSFYGAGQNKQQPNYVLNNVSSTVIGQVINISNAKNVQVGDKNVMTVHGHDDDSSSDYTSDDSDSDFDVDDGVNDFGVRLQTPMASNVKSDKKKGVTDNSWMCEDEKKTLDLTRSKRQLNHEDVTIVCDSVGNWRRFFRLLGMDDAYLEQLNQDFYAQGVKVIILEGLKEWMKKEGSHACLGRLTSTLQKIGYSDALKKFRL